jgi:hypothetical protein
MKRGVLLALLVLVLTGVGVGFAATLNVGSHHLWAGTQTLTKSTCTVTGTSADTFVDQNSPSSANSGGSTLDVLADSSIQRWAFLKFDLSTCGLPTTGGADSATLSLYMTRAPKNAFTLNLNKVSSSWPASLTWNGAQSSATTATTTAASGTTTGTWISFTVTGDVDGFIKGGANNGWRITASGATQNATKDLIQFASTESGTNEPQLVINYEK